ncbi:MAG: hypothetical protein GX259_09455 [Bacteroidales bacterium]|nr:hypothetical protein [Bacteroidales bacterium]
MKATKLFLILIISFSIFNTACKKDEATICENLLEQGNADSTSIKGEWEFKYFAKTINGSKIKNKDEIQKGYINVTDTGTILLRHTNSVEFKYKLNNSNDITMVLTSTTYVNPPPEEKNICNALNNAICFVVKGNQLLIHYKEIDKRNVLVLTKK